MLCVAKRVITSIGSTSKFIPLTNFSSKQHFHRSSLLSGHSTYVEHKDVTGNTTDTPFDFTLENYKIAKKILARYPSNYQQAGVIPLLDLAQRQCGGWLPLAAMNKVAKILEMPPMGVYEVATFYTMFNKEKVGKYLVQVCTTTPCMLCGSNEIVKACEDYLEIGLDETTPDGLFTLLEVECLGACSNAPMLQINDDFYEDLTRESTIKILDKLKKGNKPKVGPQTDRLNAAPIGIKTTLQKEIIFDPKTMATNLDKK